MVRMFALQELGFTKAEFSILSRWEITKLRGGEGRGNRKEDEETVFTVLPRQLNVLFVVVMQRI
jgi:hypothetical protein